MIGCSRIPTAQIKKSSSHEECDITCSLTVIIVETEEEKDFWWNRKGTEANRTDNFRKVTGHSALTADTSWLRQNSDTWRYYFISPLAARRFTTSNKNEEHSECSCRHSLWLRTSHQLHRFVKKKHKKTKKTFVPYNLVKFRTRTK